MQKLIPWLLSLAVASVSAEPAALLVYKVWEQGTDPYISRILVTSGHVRLDEGQDSGDFTLFDRAAGVVYSVSAEDHSVLVMAPDDTALPQQPALLLDATDEPDTEAPKVAGQTPHRVELLANGERCTTLTVLPDVMESALAGLRDMRRVLARVQARSLEAMPQEFQTACELASIVYAPTRSLDHGLPLSEQSPGRVQVLLDYVADYQADAGLFQLPQGYERIEMSALAGGE